MLLSDIWQMRYCHLLYLRNIAAIRLWILQQWQQDNAPARVAAITTYYLQRKIGYWVEWPPHSPDLNPIEQLWGYLKSQIKGMCFNSKEELFNKLSELWDSIPNEIIHNYYSSFKARLQACLQHQGACLNGKWADVHKYHAQYRTNLSIFGEIPAWFWEILLFSSILSDFLIIKFLNAFFA